MSKYRVLLPISVNGATYQYGQEVELDVATAKQYAHALVRVEEETVRLTVTEGGRTFTHEVTMNADEAKALGQAKVNVVEETK